MAGRITHRGSSQLELGYSYPRPTTGTIESATPIQTPSQAEHGLGGRFHFELEKQRKTLGSKTQKKMLWTEALLTRGMRDRVTAK